jgi:phosphatidylserine decarboxylase
LYCEAVDLDTSPDPYHQRVRAAFGISGRYHVSAVYLSIFDVHIVRAPVAGRLALHPIAPLEKRNASMGMSMFYAALKRPLPIGRRSYSHKNEFLGIQIEREDVGGPVRLVLMADWWIDQITTYVSQGDHVERGQSLAKIHMGSQVDLWTASGEYEIACRSGDRVRAGSSEIGRRSDT